MKATRFFLFASVLSFIACVGCEKSNTDLPVSDELRRPSASVHNVDGYHGVILGSGHELTDTIEWHRISRITIDGTDFIYNTDVVVNDQLVNQAAKRIQRRMITDLHSVTGKRYNVESDVFTFSPNNFITLVGLWFCNEYPDLETHVIEFEVQVYVRGSSSWANQMYTYTAMIDNPVLECNSVWTGWGQNARSLDINAFSLELDVLGNQE